MPGLGVKAEVDLIAMLWKKSCEAYRCVSGVRECQGICVWEPDGGWWIEAWEWKPQKMKGSGALDDSSVPLVLEIGRHLRKQTGGQV